jgi:hypothetical protein
VVTRGAVVCTLLAIAAGVGFFQGRKVSVAAGQELLPQIEMLAHGSQEKAKQAKEADVRAEQAEAHSKALDEKLDKASAEVARLRKIQLTATTDPEPTGTVADVPAGDPGTGALVDAQSELIRVQEEKISAQEIQIDELEKSRNLYKFMFEDISQKANYARIAHEGQLAAARATKWKWGCIGLASGAAIGFVGGLRCK